MGGSRVFPGRLQFQEEIGVVPLDPEFSQVSQRVVLDYPKDTQQCNLQFGSVFVVDCGVQDIVEVLQRLSTLGEPLFKVGEQTISLVVEGGYQGVPMGLNIFPSGVFRIVVFQVIDGRINELTCQKVGGRGSYSPSHGLFPRKRVFDYLKGV